MNDIATPVADAEAPGTDLAVLNPATSVAILTDAERFDAFYARVKEEVAGHTPDLSTAAGRKAIASLAFKVTKTKTALDEAGKKLTEDKRKEIAAVDAARKNIRDKLDALRDEVRKPLTDWEVAEEARAQRCQQVLASLKSAAVITIDDTGDTLTARIADLEAIQITAAEFADAFEFATDAKASAVQALTAGRDRLAQEEADRAELARLRREAEEREAREAAERAERERHEREAAEARQREEEERARAEEEQRRRDAAAARAKADAEAQAQAAKDAAERAAREAEERARLEERRLADEAAAEERRLNEDRLAEERRQREAAQAEAQRLAEEQAAAERKAAEEREAVARRSADVVHRGSIMRAAKEALMEHAELEEGAAKAVVLAIAAKSIPHVSIAF